MFMLLMMTILLWAGQPERSIILAWDPPASGVDHYLLYYGEASGRYTVVLDVGPAIRASVGGLKPGQLYYFAVTAVNDKGESPYSNEARARGR